MDHHEKHKSKPPKVNKEARMTKIDEKEEDEAELVTKQPTEEDNYRFNGNLLTIILKRGNVKDPTTIY